MLNRSARLAPSAARGVAVRPHLTSTLSLAFVCAIAFALIGATTASAAFTITDWKLTPSSTQTAGHPSVNFHLDPDAAKGDQNGDDLMSVTIDFGAGMLANSAAIPRPCTSTEFGSDTCAASTVLGSAAMRYRKGTAYSTMYGTMYQLTRDANSVMSFGIVLRPTGFRKIFVRSSKVTGLVSVRTGLDSDYGLSATVPAIPRTLTTTSGAVSNITIAQFNVTLASKTSTGKYMTFNPTRCTPAISRATMVSYLGVTVPRTSSFTPTGCANVPFTPTVAVSASNYDAGAATGLSATLSIPTADATIQQSHLRDLTVTMPLGTRLNSSAIAALPALCSDAQLATNACPAGSQIGTASADVPFLPPAMTGKIYLVSRDSTALVFGLVLQGAQNTTVIVKGQATMVDLDADGVTETIRASLSGLPQAPYSTATISFTAPVAVNPTSGCGSARVSAVLNGYSGASSTKNVAYPLAHCPPVVTITNPANGSQIGTQSFNAAFSATSPTGTAITGFQCKLENLSTARTLSDAACVDGQAFSGLGNGQQHRLTVTATDADGTKGASSTTFTVNAPPPAAPTPFNGPIGVATTDRTPTFVLAYPQAAAFPNAALQCAITDRGVAPTSWTICGAAALGGGQFTSPVALTNGAYQFNARAVDGFVVSSPVVVPFGVTDWASTFTTQLSTLQAAAHPDMDVEFRPAAGQLRSTAMLLPRGLLGSLRAFPACDVAVANTGGCDVSTQVGTAAAGVTVLGITAPASESHGTVFLTYPRVAGDIGGFMVKLPSPNPALAPVLVPLRIKLENNSQQMRIFNDALPVTTTYLPTGSQVDMYVNSFQLHINGSTSAPGYPTKLITNPSNCELSSLVVSMGDNEGNSVTQTLPFMASGCGTVPFTPTVEQITPSPVAGQSLTLKNIITIPAEQSSVKTVTVYQPPAIGPNFPAFGAPGDMCPAASAPAASSLFDSSQCPPQSAVGTISLISPLLPVPVTGKVHLINKSPVPWLGADAAFAPLGVRILLVGVNTIADPDPACDPNVDMCDAQRLKTTFGFSPDIPVTTITLDLSGPSRTAASGATLSPDMLVTASSDDPSCITDSKIKSIVDPNSGGAGVTAFQPVTIGGCSQ